MMQEEDGGGGQMSPAATALAPAATSPATTITRLSTPHGEQIITWLNSYMTNDLSNAQQVLSELETYLAKPPVPRVPASTVASESAFSTGQRVISAFRSRLTPETAEALVCLQDWMRASGSSQLSMASIHDIIGQDEHEGP